MNDHRFCKNVAATVPTDAPAAYGARWIDKGNVADILPDRQGLAYDDPKDRDRLLKWLKAKRPNQKIGTARRETPTNLIEDNVAECWIIRRGGYVYVDAWLK